MSELGERMASLEAKVERMETIEQRLNQLDSKIAYMFGGLAALQIVIGVTLAVLKLK
tara:strand:+ start:273 stop:443 length:171 start_codon:yes stop_codon:yes gene_type:complete